MLVTLAGKRQLLVVTAKRMVGLGVEDGALLWEYPWTTEYDVNASQPLSVWRAKGWIHPDDPRGWFQWYCRYFSGRRHPDDVRQIKRWLLIRRHVSQLRRNCPERALDCRPRQRQALLHWAYDSRQI